MKLKKLISAAVSAVMLLGTAPVLQVSAGAADAETETRVISPTWDIQLRKGNSYAETHVSTEGGLEINSNVNMCIGYRFDIPEVSGKVIKSAKLRLTNERNKDMKDITVYELDASKWTTADTTYEALDIDNVMKGDGVVKFDSVGHSGKSIYWDTISADFNSAEKWMSNVELPVTQMIPGSKYAFVLANPVTEDRQAVFFSKEKGDQVVNTDANTTVTFASDDLVPKLTLEYGEPEAEWTEYRENEFTGAAADHSIAWKITSNTNDRKGASHTVDTENKILTISSNQDVEANNVLYGVNATIKNVQENTKYTITFKEKSTITQRANNGLYLMGCTFATNAASTDPDQHKDMSDIKNAKIADIHTSEVTDTDWEDKTYTYVTGSGFPEGYDTGMVRMTFMFRGITGTVKIKDLKITGAAAPEPTPTPSPVPAPLKADNATSYNVPIHNGDVIDPLDTDDVFQYHFAGGTNDYMNGTTETGKKYDAYMWIPKSASPDTLRGLVAIKMNLIEVPFAYSGKLKTELAKKNFGILFIIDENDAIPDGYTGSGKNYKNILQGMYTRKDYQGNDLFTNAKWQTWDGKDAADIMNDIMNGLADVSGYTCVANNTPIITIGHSAASPFGYRSGNWAYNRVIAQIDMKNGMWGDATNGSNADDDLHGYGMVPGIPSLQFAAQYTEHSNGVDRDRSVRDARYHIDHQRAVSSDYLVSHIIEWGSGHYDWSPNATDIMIKYITKAIDYRLPETFTGGNAEYMLNDLSNTGYLMKPFEKDNGAERPINYYKDTLKGWLSSGKNNNSASENDKKASFWYFDEEFANTVNSFTSYAIPESPDPNGTGISGKSFSEYEPYMLMKHPSNSVYANTKYDFNNYISPSAAFDGGMSRYGNTRFINYEKMENPGSGNGDNNPQSGATNTAALGGYDTLTVDTYYMNKIPAVTNTKGYAYDGAGGTAPVPGSTKAELIPLMAPYELVDSELISTNGMTKDGSELADSVAAVTRNTLRFHNNRVYYDSGCAYTNEAGTSQGSFAMIYSPEVKDGNNIISTFKSTGVQMNVPYVNKGTRQELTLNKINDVSIQDADKKIDVSYTSTDSDLQKYTDVFVNYGPARAVRTVDAQDGSYSWQIEILKDEIPEGAKFPIKVGIVASNLGKWETVYGDAAETEFNIYDSYKIENAGNVTVQNSASAGETVNITVPANYVENSLVVSGIKASDIYKVSETVYSFTMPESSVKISCLVNDSSSNKIIIASTPEKCFTDSNNPMPIKFNVPELAGYKYVKAELRVPCRANDYNARAMSAVLNGENKSVKADITAEFTAVNAGENTITITNTGGGVDYFSYDDPGWSTVGFDYPQTAEDLSTLTLTKAVSAATTELINVDVSGATENQDAKGYYFKNLALPSWNPTLKWVITFNDDKKASSEIKSFPKVTGGSANIGLVVYGTMANNEKTYTTSDIQSVAIVE